MKTQSFLNVMCGLFLLVAVVSLGFGAKQFVAGDPPGHYAVLFIGGTFWLLCSAVAFFLRSRIA